MIKKILICMLSLGLVTQLAAHHEHAYDYDDACKCDCAYKCDHECTCDSPCTCDTTCSNWQVMFKQGYFYPHDKSLRCMFKNGCHHPGGYYLEGDLRYGLFCGLFLELSGSWFRQKGCSLVCVKSTTVRTSTATPATTTQPAAKTLTYGERFIYKLPTFGFGVKYFYDLCDNCLNIFAGIGGKVFFMRERADYCGCCRCDKSNTVGGYVGGGLQWTPFCGFTFEPFVDYMFKKTSNKKAPKCSVSRCLELGGVVAGIGIGYKF